MADSASQQFTKLPSSSKILLLALLLAMIGAGYYSLLHGPLNEEIDGVIAQKAVLDEQLAKSKELQARFLKLREELEVRKLAEVELVRVLPPRAEIATMLAELNRLAELSGLAIQAVEPLGEEAAQYYYRIPVNVAVSGKYHQLAKFFYNVSRLQRAINMENIVITEPRLQGDDLVLKVRVLATTFRRKDA
jgi:type IV pilus assembly protein PilO